MPCPDSETSHYLVFVYYIESRLQLSEFGTFNGCIVIDILATCFPQQYKGAHMHTSTAN
jgi:hypothetical protein